MNKSLHSNHPVCIAPKPKSQTPIAVNPRLSSTQNRKANYETCESHNILLAASQNEDQIY